MVHLNDTTEWENVNNELIRQGKSIECVFAGDTDVDQLLVERIYNLSIFFPNFYSSLIHTFFPGEISEDEARTLWIEIQHHKEELNRKLFRNVGLRVAALDYLENVKHKFKKTCFVEEKLFHETFAQASHDSLTRLLNRKYFILYLDELIQKNIPFCFAFVDIDSFKKYNDCFGHLCGDRILVSFSKLLTEFIDQYGGNAGRYGGDEFMICFPVIPVCDSLNILEQLRKMVEATFVTEKITVSIGLVESGLNYGSVESLIALADELLYRVKEFGGNRVFTLQKVKFDFTPKECEKLNDVALVGDFNNWDRKKGIMSFDQVKESWSTEILLKPGKYRYKFLIDSNIWVADPGCTNYADDGFGGVCSVITVDSHSDKTS